MCLWKVDQMLFLPSILRQILPRSEKLDQFHRGTLSPLVAELLPDSEWPSLMLQNQ